MSRENVKVVRRLYGCWAAAEFDRMPEMLHPEIVWTAIESGPPATVPGLPSQRPRGGEWLHGRCASQGFDFGDDVDPYSTSTRDPGTPSGRGAVCVPAVMACV